MASGGQLDRPDMTLRPVRTYASQCCGVVASYPAHKRELSCEAKHAARIWRSPAAVTMRQAQAALRAFTDEPAASDDEWVLGYVALSGALNDAVTGLLAELDREATGVRR